MKEYALLFNVFFKIGILTFGGGYSMLPMLDREVVKRHNWVSSDDMLDYFAIGQCTPGVIAVNTATIVGYKVKGFWGSAIATAGVVMPSLIIITLIAAVLDNFSNHPVVIHAFAGIRVAVAALILSAVVKLFKSNVLKKARYESVQELIKYLTAPLLLCIISFVLVAFLRVSPVYIVIGATIIGVLFYSKRGDA